jgi:hypothetical protein
VPRRRRNAIIIGLRAYLVHHWKQFRIFRVFLNEDSPVFLLALAFATLLYLFINCGDSPSVLFPVAVTPLAEHVQSQM